MIGTTDSACLAAVGVAALADAGVAALSAIRWAQHARGAAAQKNTSTSGVEDTGVADDLEKR